MKIINTTAFALACLLAQVATCSETKSLDIVNKASVNSNINVSTTADVDTSCLTGDCTKGKSVKISVSANVTTAANFDPSGAKMEVCPSGDCKGGNSVRISVLSLTELTSAGVEVANNKVTSFTAASSDWTAITTSLVAGVNVSTTMFVSKLTVGGTSLFFNLTASIPESDWTVTYGSETLIVPAGALKFTVDIGKWPFAGTSNTLALALKLDAKGPNNKSVDKPKKEKTQGANANANATIDRVDMGANIFMDAPSIVIIDGTEASVINSSVVEVGSDTAFQWVFPHFINTLHYDPVVGDNTTTTTTSSSSSSDDASAASTLSLSSLAAAGLAALAYSFF